MIDARQQRNKALEAADACVASTTSCATAGGGMDRSGGRSRMDNKPADGQSEFGLDRKHTVGQKLFQSLVLLLLGAFFGVFTALTVTLVADPWVRFGLQTGLEVCWVFWGLAIIVVWCQPRWLQSHYLRAERRMLRLGVVLKFATAILLFVAVALVAYLIQIGVLPLEPR